MAEAATATTDLLAQPDPPTAIFAASDDMALGVIERLRGLGRRLTDDVAVVGFDGIPLTRDIDPPLTTIRVPFHELGRRAAELLLGTPTGTDAAQLETLPVELILGGSS
jgi:DNA-binding LacI/PurR family transcriptional regulator